MGGGGCCTSGKCHGSTALENRSTRAGQHQHTTALLHLSPDSSIIITGTTETPSTAGLHEMGYCGICPHSNTDTDDERNSVNWTPPAQPWRSADTKRIVLTIQGLKCGCCGNGISRALGHIPGVQNHHVNVVLAKAEFDLDVRTTSVSRVKKKLAAVTGYTFKQYFQPDGQVLEILVDDPEEICRAGKPYGVNLVEPNARSVWTPRIFSGRNSAVPPGSPAFIHHRKEARKETKVSSEDNTRTKANLLHTQGTVRLHYDAEAIGAREVLSYYEQWAEKEIKLAPPTPHPSLAAGSKQTKRACAVFLLAAIFTIPVVIFAWGPVDHGKSIFVHLSLAFATVVQAIAMWEFYPSAFRSLIHSSMFDMDSLIAMSTTVAYVFSVISYTLKLKGRPLETGSFFETSTLLVALILLGRVISEFARSRAAKSVSFRSLQVEEAHLVLPGASSSDPPTRIIDSRLLQYGDLFKVLPEARIVTDGVVVHGGSEVDESMITGEPLPVAKGRTSTVFAGTNNGTSTLIVALTRLPHENSVSRIATMVENAELTKPRVQAIADRIAAWFVPAIILIALLVFTIWMLLYKYRNHNSTSQAAIKAFTYAIATLVVSCPCAIGLAVPMVILIASGIAARAGIIFRDPRKLETARNVTDVVFDKTGTLTTGVLIVARASFPNGSEREVKSMLLGLLNGMKHPVSIAVRDWVLLKQGVPMLPTDMISVLSFPGEGLQGMTKQGNHLVCAGNPNWLNIDLSTIDHDHNKHDDTLFCVTIDGIHRATFFLKSRVRTTAKSTITYLHSRNIRVHMLTGDNEHAAAGIAQAVGIPPTLVHSGLKPEEKKAYVEAQQADGKTVMFVGDGTNDAIALKQAAIGVHLNRGSDVARSAADIVLMNPHLLDLIVLLDISHAAYRRIILNFVWSGLYNIVAVLLAAGAFRVWRVEPKYAGLGELVSVLPVVGVAFSMKWRGYGSKYRREESRAAEE